MGRGLAAAVLPGGRLHLQQGPIDLVIGADGTPDAVATAFAAARRRFAGLLEELVGELPLLRAPAGRTPAPVAGTVARRMVDAVHPHRHVFVTPMAAVAGAVADEIMAAMLSAAPLDRAYVNDGGDIALHLARGQEIRVGVVADIAAAVPGGVVTVPAESPVRGIATSGWRGRSLSLGIADAATALAASAAAADAAATLIANAVTVDDPAVRRMPATAVIDDSDLGDMLVTVQVGRLAPPAVAAALDAGTTRARGMLADGLICGAILALAGETRIVGPLAGRLTGAARPLELPTMPSR